MIFFNDNKFKTATQLFAVGVASRMMRRLFKFAHTEEEQEVLSAQSRSVQMVHEDTSTEATQLFAVGVEFKKASGFTLLEVILAMTIMVLLAGAIYSISSAAIESTKEAIVEQFTMRRLAGFLQITRNAFLNLPADGTIFLSNDSNNSIPDLNFENATGLFGIASLGGGMLTLSAQPSSDGTRTFSVLRIPKNVQGTDLNHFYQNASWVKLLPNVKKPHWSFFYRGEWTDEWPRGSGRPQLVRLEMEVAGLQEPIESIFYVPAMTKISFGTPGNKPGIPTNNNSTNPNSPNSNSTNPNSPNNNSPNTNPPRKPF